VAAVAAVAAAENLFAFYVSEGFCVVLINPRRTPRFAGEDPERTMRPTPSSPSSRTAPTTSTAS
jgi:hypothetical protein